MANYKIKTHERHWLCGYYEVEAKSEEEAIELVCNGEGLVDWDNDCIDQIDIEQVKETDD